VRWRESVATMAQALYRGRLTTTRDEFQALSKEAALFNCDQLQVCCCLIDRFVCFLRIRMLSFPRLLLAQIAA
jgi:hypothetical protein